MTSPVCWAVVPAGGSGSRFSASQDKLLTPLRGQPVLVHTIAALLACPEIAGLVLVASEQNLPIYQKLLTEHFPDARLCFTVGGRTRRASVYQGLLALPVGVDVVAVHDAARPLIQPAIVSSAIAAVLNGSVGSVVAQPVVDTVKQVDPKTLQVLATMDRTTLWRAQTPQVFKYQDLMTANRLVAPEIDVTDDAQLLELAGLGPLSIISGSVSNLKITGPDDIPLAESFLHRVDAHSPTVVLP